MGAEMERVETCVRYIREKTGFEPHTALVLGSGLGGFADNVKIEAEMCIRDRYGAHPG